MCFTEWRFKTLFLWWKVKAMTFCSVPIITCLSGFFLFLQFANRGLLEGDGEMVWMSQSSQFLEVLRECALWFSLEWGWYLIVIFIFMAVCSLLSQKVKSNLISHYPKELNFFAPSSFSHTYVVKSYLHIIPTACNLHTCTQDSEQSWRTSPIGGNYVYESLFPTSTFLSMWLSNWTIHIFNSFQKLPNFNSILHPDYEISCRFS